MTDLLNLIRLGLVAPGLEIENLLDPILGVNVVTPSNSFLKAQV